MSVLADFIATREYIDSPMYGAEFDDLDLALMEPATRPAPIPPAQERRDISPCGWPHAHHRSPTGLWSAGAYLCKIANYERQDRKTVTVALRKSPRFASLRAAGGALTAHPVFLPFLATVTPDGRTVYRRILAGESLRDVAASVGVEL